MNDELLLMNLFAMHIKDTLWNPDNRTMVAFVVIDVIGVARGKPFTREEQREFLTKCGGSNFVD